MKFVLAVHGTRGDVEPCAAVGLELVRRGHEVRMAVPPNLTAFVESAGLTAVSYGPDSQQTLDEDFFRKFWKIQNPVNLVRIGAEYITRGWAEMSTTLASLADGADLVLTGMIYQEVAANVAEYHGIPLATLHYFPIRPNGHVIPIVPGPLIRSSVSAIWWLHWGMIKKAEDDQRRALGLSKATGPASRRMAARGALEIQAYDELCFPGLAAEWDGQRPSRPFVGSLTMELPTAADDDVASWIAAGTPPIYFGFGSMPVESFPDTVRMIAEVCARLDERALICSGNNDLDDMPQYDHVKVVSAVSHAAIFPVCRAIVHHGGAGTTAAALRAGVPMLILWIGAEQPIWAAQIRRLNVGKARRFSSTSRRSLVGDLREILRPRYVTRARETATRTTKAAASVTVAADLVEQMARAAAAKNNVTVVQPSR
jgi:UDP:flavonoid glycosyltransferase YjiC (YdhE family)